VRRSLVALGTGGGDRMTYRNGVYEASGLDNWMTPPDLLEKLTEEYGELYDPCPAYHDFSFDGLEIEWSRDKVCFVNPPYSQMKEWVKKSHDEWRAGSTVILLIPPRTCTRYFHDYINERAEVRFIKGRLKFVHPNGEDSKSAPFPSILCIFK
tara:strand:- start:33 stop:491 length:459 start_codon:yes stop_codon:yes gene_type:complete